MKNELIKRIISSVILIPTVFLIISLGSYFFNLFITICFLIISYEWYEMAKKKNYVFFGYFFLIFSFYSIYKLRNIDGEGFDFVLLILLICICSDIGGYVFGKTFRGKKLTQISPNKTYSGAIGSFLLPIIFILILLNYNFNNMYINNLLSNFSLIKLFLITISVSLVSQIGDIFISFFKRLKNIKDTGKLIPGHGGLLDRIDGMIFAIPYSYILILLIS